MVNKDMNGFPVKKCSAFQFFKKRVRRWIKSPMVSVDKHQSPSLKCTGPSVVHIPPPEPSFEPSFCQTCLGDHAFPRGVLSPEKESCSWETQSGCEVKEPCNHANILTKPDPRTFWTNDDSVPEAYLPSGTAFWISKYIRVLGDGAEKLISFLERVTKEQDEEGKDPGPSLPSRGQRVSKPEGQVATVTLSILSHISFSRLSSRELTTGCLAGLTRQPRPEQRDLLNSLPSAGAVPTTLA